MRPRLRPPDDSYEYPAWCGNALGGLPAAIDPGLFLSLRKRWPHRRHSQIRLDRAAKFARLVVESRCADLFHVAIHQIDQRAVRQADAGLRHPAQRRLATTGRGGLTGIVGQHLADLLLHRE